MADNGHVVVEVKNLRRWYDVTRGLILTRKLGTVKAVDGVSLAIREGETLGLVGESGSGKTTFAKLVLRLEPPTDGQVLFEGRDIYLLKGRDLDSFKRKVQLVFQDPVGSLNPRMRVRDIVAEPIAIHGLEEQGFSKGMLDIKFRLPFKVRNHLQQLVELVGLPPDSMGRYPHEFSGGQRQRIGIARALALRPKFVVLDEPVSALDVSIRAQILNLLRDLQQQLSLTYLFIAHDLAVVKYISTRVAVMYLGKIVEYAPVAALYGNPRHPYTITLLSAVLTGDPEEERKRKDVVAEGEIPSPMNPPSGCPFRTRCWMAVEDCVTVEPPLAPVEPGHYVACIRANEVTTEGIV